MHAKCDIQLQSVNHNLIKTPLQYCIDYFCFMRMQEYLKKKQENRSDVVICT